MFLFESSIAHYTQHLQKHYEKHKNVRIFNSFFRFHNKGFPGGIPVIIETNILNI